MLILRKSRSLGRGRDFKSGLQFICSLLAVTCAGGDLALAKSPGKGEMLLFRSTGSMWGVTENAFSEHAFSLKSNRGAGMWRDSMPDKMTMINPENKTYFIESMDDFFKDNNYATDIPVQVESFEVLPHEPVSGLPCVETVFRRNRFSKRLAKGLRNEVNDNSALFETVKDSITARASLAQSASTKGKASATAAVSTNGKAADGPSLIYPTPVKRAAAKYDIEVVRVLSLKGISLPPAMLKAWSRVMLTNPQSGFAVTTVLLPGIGCYSGEKPTLRRRTLVAFRSIQFVPLDQKRFEIPKDFKHAKDKSAFYLSESGELKKSDIDDLFTSTDLK